jgi:hypothetical protein
MRPIPTTRNNFITLHKYLSSWGPPFSLASFHHRLYIRTSGSKWTIFSGRMDVTHGLILPTPLKHIMLLRLLIIKEFLNDRPTRQKRTLILPHSTGFSGGAWQALAESLLT